VETPETTPAPSAAAAAPTTQINLRRDELTWRLLYAMRFGRLQANLYDRVSSLLRFIIFLAGTSAFLAFLGKNDALIAIAGLIGAAAAVLDSVSDFAGKAAKTREMANRFAAIKLESHSLSDDELERRLDALEDAHIPEIDSLRFAAYNDVLKETGRYSDSTKCTLNPLQWILAQIA